MGEKDLVSFTPISLLAVLSLLRNEHLHQGGVCSKRVAFIPLGNLAERNQRGRISWLLNKSLKVLEVAADFANECQMLSLSSINRASILAPPCCGCLEISLSHRS